MKALTVQQPWAWAIMHGGKTIENRTQAWTYRGPLAIHAGLQWSADGAADSRIHTAFGGRPRPTQFLAGVVLGTVDLVDIHDANMDCCEPWGGSSFPRRVTHLVLENPRPLTHPIPCQGALGLWTPPRGILAALIEELPEEVH